MKVRHLVLAVPRDHRLLRLVQLYAGLLLYGVSSSLLIVAHHGLVPWDVFHQGVSEQTGIPIGTCAIIVSLLLLLLWIPLRERPGIGTISNAIVIGATINIFLWATHDPSGEATRWACVVLGVLFSGVATGFYIGAGLGRGPRDGLMTGLVRRTGHSLRLVRTLIEAVVLASGWLLGGSIGVGTVLYLVLIGPLAHIFVPLLSLEQIKRAAGRRS